jgi:uncharacterized membrane protein
MAFFSLKKNTVLEICVLAVVMVSLDTIFMTIHKEKYERQLIRVQKTSLQLKRGAMAACYLFLVLGLYYFVVKDRRPLQDAFYLGVLIAGALNLTNYAIIKNWELEIVVHDTLWGGVSMGVSAFLCYKFYKQFLEQ